VARKDPIFCDTSILIAAHQLSHEYHGPCLALISGVKQGTGYCALHSYAEVYAVLSGMPSRPRLRPTDVDAMIDRIDRVFTPIALTRKEYRDIIVRHSKQGVTGGRLYDALILACAVKSEAKTIYTLNEKDFKTLATSDVQPLIRRP
jgi:predicted nucleic acid-binding protein